ncbi:hypothetical protein M422DRAFT_264454 [Sphaerobolus stellatus SS14]|uniref:Calcineurin-like phosphoesterase domain-containing protein n=1 Tax=Sphaerobolus stellatus (strain SS14) TaxID=990650 RepID=A0A0C9V7X3_SPHS4|nr:hypothetical protein M422DRAFT_264454 [Sphaerobolus stellatus SS14]
MKFLGILSVFVAIAITPAFACEEGHEHEHERRDSSVKPQTPTVSIASPTVPLVWGDINIIHTTDSHGWLLGHQKTSPPEPNYSGDFGDFSSFVQHMKAEADRRGVDLLLIDSGDLHDGTGLSDGFPAGGVDAHDSNAIFSELPYDVLAIGNHELYIYANTLDVYQNFAPKWNGRYLSSNVNITVADKHGNAVSTPVGSRFTKFKTKRGRKVTSLGVLYDFTGNDKNTTVQPVAAMVQEAWFKEAIQEQPDVFVLVGHMPVQRDNWPLVFNAIRAVHPLTPILILGGHTHIRDCVQLDNRSMSLESGRYMETVGWLTVKLDDNKSNKPLTFSRRYLDPNRVTYQFHTGLGNLLFNTLQGITISAQLQGLAKRFDLSQAFGTAPQDYFLSRAAFTSNQSLPGFFIREVVPFAISVNNSRASIPNVILSNSGSQRFDLFAGSFTKNDQLTVSPFTDAFQFIENVPFSVASQILDDLNDSNLPSRKRAEESMAELYRRGDVSMRFNEWLQDQWERAPVERRTAQNLTVGYVTTDSCPGAGDDTLHSPLTFFEVPDFIGSNLPNVSSSDLIDVVFLDFIASSVVTILNQIVAGTDTQNFSTADVKSYTDILTNEVFGVYAQAKWN